ncbi:dispanin subfamily A member 2b-like [Leucoraja erinacea]|uniref:dispanin subfamily A member 2b-like n=1 Tax=Leucoraja erinaceus TaxID=7782 RepID=UPI002454C073|nr:dispanin subfamily A member 2b-like [Leucoraja erinacea]
MESRMNQALVENDQQSPGKGRCPEIPATMVHIATEPLPVKDHFLWSMFNFVYCNFCCLGFMALAFSVKARDRKMLGDIYSANHYGATSKALNLAATLLTIALVITVVALAISGVIHLRPR